MRRPWEAIGLTTLLRFYLTVSSLHLVWESLLRPGHLPVGRHLRSKPCWLDVVP